MWGRETPVNTFGYARKCVNTSSPCNLCYQKPQRAWRGVSSRRSQPPLALAVPLSRFTSRVGGGSAFYVRRLTHAQVIHDLLIMNLTSAFIRTVLMAALLYTASFVLPCAHAQQSDAVRIQFLEFKSKAERGDAQAQSNLGLCYAQGRGVAKDDVEAVKWFRMAAEQDYAKAQN